MQDTLRGSIHSFVDHVKITNTNHLSAAVLLRRMAQFYHVGLVVLKTSELESKTTPPHLPNFLKSCNSAPYADHCPYPMEIEGYIDLLSLCFSVIFANVLDFRTYSSSITIKPKERWNMAYARGICLGLVRAWDERYVVYQVSTGEEIGDFSGQYLAQEAWTLLCYKSSAERDGREGAQGCTVALLHHEISNVIVLHDTGFRNWKKLLKFEKPEDDLILGFTSEQKRDWNIRRRRDLNPVTPGELHLCLCWTLVVTEWYHLEIPP